MGAERLGALALAVAALLAAGCRGSTTTDDGAPQAGGTTAVVEWVNDGDTLTLTNGAKVRLVQVDAPELGPTATAAPRSRP